MSAVGLSTAYAAPAANSAATTKAAQGAHPSVKAPQVVTRDFLIQNSTGRDIALQSYGGCSDSPGAANCAWPATGNPAPGTVMPNGSQLWVKVVYWFAQDTTGTLEFDATSEGDGSRIMFVLEVNSRNFPSATEYPGANGYTAHIWVVQNPGNPVWVMNILPAGAQSWEDRCPAAGSHPLAATTTKTDPHLQSKVERCPPGQAKRLG